MPIEDARDPRDRLVREKYFSLRPQPLEQWLWRQEIAPSAERVFWLHWQEGMRNGTWCSALPLKRVAALCALDVSSVTRAYQQLAKMGLVRRQDPGRDPGNPFQRATAVTEVRVPRELLAKLIKSPNRPRTEGIDPVSKPQSDATCGIAVAHAPAAASEAPEGPDTPSTSQVSRLPTRQEIQATWGRASAAERGRYFNASREGLPIIEFDPDTALTPEDRGQLLTQLQQMARARSSTCVAPKCAQVPSISPGYARARRLSPLEFARTRKRVLERVAAGEAREVLRQVVWAVEEGALGRFEMPHAVNIALKKIGEGAWTRPHRMPPNWSRELASSEVCRSA
jgi:hypothetical protein